MPIPSLDDETGYLPPGDHYATMEEVGEAFAARGIKRRELFQALVPIVKELVSRGVTKICVDGSYISRKRRPRDVDVWYEPPEGATPKEWGRIASTNEARHKLKESEGVDLCYPPMRGGTQRNLLPDYWREKDGVPKGIIWLTDLEAVLDTEESAQ